jgi:hypothetical protein
MGGEKGRSKGEGGSTTSIQRRSNVRSACVRQQCGNHTRMQPKFYVNIVIDVNIVIYVNFVIYVNCSNLYNRVAIM